eukprot:UN08975
MRVLGHVPAGVPLPQYFNDPAMLQDPEILAAADVEARRRLMAQQQQQQQQQAASTQTTTTPYK